ncbi:MAG: hypothetical protein ABR992_10355 [Solirubrobacteraceae bacterium]
MADGTHPNCLSAAVATGTGTAFLLVEAATCKCPPAGLLIAHLEIELNHVVVSTDVG